MSKEAEGGGFGTAQTKSYTFLLWMAVGGGVIWFARQDLGEDGARYLSTAFGIQSDFWIWVCMVVGTMILSSSPVSTVSVIYSRYTGTVYTEDRLGFAKSGAQDIGVWSGLLTFIGTLYIFARFIPPGFLWIFRPFVLLIISTVAGHILARVTSNMVFSALFGPPRRDVF